MKLPALLGVLCALCVSAEARVFTNLKGQTIEGSLTGVDASNADILRGDGRKFKVALNTLSAEDQKFCTDWRTANPEMKLTVKADGVTAAGTRQTTNSQDSQRSGTTSASITARTRMLEEGYRISISNWSKTPGTKIGGLTVDYAIVVGFFDTTARDKRGVKEIVRGSVSVPELAGSKVESVLTKTVKTGQTAAVATSSSEDSSGDSTTATAGVVYRESMDGIALVVRRGERIVATYSVGRVPKEVQLNVAGK